MDKSKRPNVLFLSYTGLLEPIMSSQGIPYLEGLAASGYRFTLLTYEKKQDLKRVGSDEVSRIRRDLADRGIEWKCLRYHKRPKAVSTFFDICVGTICSFFLIMRKRIRIVHVRGVTPGAMMIPLHKVLGVKLLFDMRGRLAEEMAAGGLWRPESAQFRMIKAAEKYLLKTSDAVTVLTQRHMGLNRSIDYVRNRDIPMDVIPCSVDTKKFDYRSRDVLAFKKRLGVEGRFIVMYQGKIGTFYLADKMLDFYKKLLEAVPNTVFFVLTVDDPDVIIKLADRKGINKDGIKVVRNERFELIPDYLSIADAGIFFINSHEKLGSSPIKLGEFLSCGIPVIINPGVGDTDSFVRDHRVGVVVNGFEEQNYEDAIEELLRLKKDKAGLQERCRQAAEEHLSLTDAVARYAAIYEAMNGSITHSGLGCSR